MVHQANPEPLRPSSEPCPCAPGANRVGRRQTHVAAKPNRTPRFDIVANHLLILEPLLQSYSFLFILLSCTPATVASSSFGTTTDVQTPAQIPFSQHSYKYLNILAQLTPLYITSAIFTSDSRFLSHCHELVDKPPQCRFQHTHPRPACRSPHRTSPAPQS